MLQETRGGITVFQWISLVTDLIETPPPFDINSTAFTEMFYS